MKDPIKGNWYAIEGCKTGQGADKKWPPRKEFDTFLKDKKQAVLFFVALEKLCKRPLNERLSYFQLAGEYSM